MSADGVLVVDKPRGPTSHDVVAEARRVLGTRAVGHAGTLDPMASGVLVLLVGQATKLAAYITLDDKEYQATVEFGRATDTLDAEGTTTEERPLPDGALAPDRLMAALDRERWRTTQIPPAFSAISVGGQRAHRLSRRGQTVELPERAVAVRELELVSCDDHSATVRLSVSKGYYVRSLARDLGASLGVPAHLSALVRRASGPYRLEDAAQWPPTGPVGLESVLNAAARVLPIAKLTVEGTLRAEQGKVLDASHFSEPRDTVSLWIDPSRELVAVGSAPESGVYRVLRGFVRARPNPMNPMG